MTLFGAGFICGGFVVFVAMCVAELRANGEAEGQAERRNEDERQRT